MTSVVRIKRKVRPLQKTYDPAAPFVVERHDQEDGAIHYEIWDERQDSYRRLCTVMEDYNDDSEDGSPERGQSLKDANLIARALNFMHGYKPC